MTLTLGRAIELFLGEHIPTTAKSYRATLARLRDFVGPARPLEKVRPEHLIEYMQALREREEIKSAATVNKHIKTVRVFFNWCLKGGLMTGTSPALALRRVRQQKTIGREKAMPETVYAELLAYARYTPRQHALALFLGDTGCRIGGAAGLRWQDVNLEGRAAVVTEKGAKTRPVFYGEVTAAALARWRAQQGEGAEYVFSQDGKAIKADSLGQFFERMCRRAGLGKWGPHSLRHRKGHQLADNHVAPSLAAKALGHSSPVTTMEYYYPEDWERVQAEMEKLSQKAGQKAAKIIPLAGNH